MRKNTGSHKEIGATSVEFTLVAALIGILCMGAVAVLGTTGGRYFMSHAGSGSQTQSEFEENMQALGGPTPSYP